MKRVTLLGEYSSGKTALLNALLGEMLFQESIIKETAIATNVFYTTEKSFYTIKTKLGIISLQHPFVAPFNTKSFAQDVTEVNVHLNNASMCDFFKRNIFFTDLPGSNSGDEQHEKIITQYAAKSDVLLVCVPANKGNISNGLLNLVKETCKTNPKIKLLGVTTKSGLPDIDDGGIAHNNLLKETITKNCLKNILTFIRTDAKNGSTTELKLLLMYSEEFRLAMSIYKGSKKAYSFFKKILKTKHLKNN